MPKEGQCVRHEFENQLDHTELLTGVDLRGRAAGSGDHGLLPELVSFGRSEPNFDGV